MITNATICNHARRIGVDLHTHPIVSIRLSDDEKVQAIRFHPFISSARGESRFNAKMYPSDTTIVKSVGPAHCIRP